VRRVTVCSLSAAGAADPLGAHSGSHRRRARPRSVHELGVLRDSAAACGAVVSQVSVTQVSMEFMMGRTCMRVRM